MSQVALITGITGQDGSYLAELLLAKGYEVHGIIRRASSFNTGRIDHLYQDAREADVRLTLHHGDVTDATVLRRIVDRVQPKEVYNLAAQSHVRVSFDLPVHTADTCALGTLRLLEALREHAHATGEDVRFYQASSSEMYGRATESPQTETTPFRPRSPYAAAKLFAHWTTVNYREAHGLHASCGIAFNHESPRRGETFVTRKITRAVGRIKHGLQADLHLGNLDARRDWGFAGDHARAMHLMLQQEEPDDYVIATGRSHSVREFLEAAFALADLDPYDFVAIDERYLRPTEVDALEGDPSKARRRLGWEPEVEFGTLVRMMVEADLELAARERTLCDGGHDVPARRPPET